VTVAARIFAVLAAVLLVAAFALAALVPEGLNLGQGIAAVNRDWLNWLTQRGPGAGWIWEWVEKPLLVRPVWLLPAAFGLVCAGAALTFSSGGPQGRSRRHRS
jgi:hypothetical protein